MSSRKHNKLKPNHKSHRERSPSPYKSSDSENELDNDERAYKPTSPAQWSHHRHSIVTGVNGTVKSEGANSGNQAQFGPAYRSPISALPPEMLIHIFRQLTDTSHLYKCLFVSSLWCQCAVELLWLKPHLTKKRTFFAFLAIISPGFNPRAIEREDTSAFTSTEAVVNGQRQNIQRIEQPTPESSPQKGNPKPEPLFPYARFVRRLNLSGVAEEVKDMHFLCLAACHRLERLTLNGCVHLTDKSLSILSGMVNLIALDLTGVVDVTDATPLAVAASSSKLQGVNLEGCKRVTDTGVTALADNCPLLRRIKLCELDSVTNVSVSRLARNCPLLIEIDLTSCTAVGNAAVRDIWSHCSHLRELRLSGCLNVTDVAFPAPQRISASTQSKPEGLQQSEDHYAKLVIPVLPPLLLKTPLIHLRQLDLMSLRITDDAVAGIVSNAPKLRNLVLAKCSLLTDAAVQSISELGRHLQILHLGHAAAITDTSIINLAKSCVRLRYVDLACCTSLTDESVRALAALPKLRRIGLVRVINLTDEAIEHLTLRYSTLERVHLSYCEHISIKAIHLLLRRLTRLTHLSLTAVPAFRRRDLQQFCRPPPSSFNDIQRAAFCVYSGNSIHRLREYLDGLAPRQYERGRQPEPNDSPPNAFPTSDPQLSETDDEGRDIEDEGSGLYTGNFPHSSMFPSSNLHAIGRNQASAGTSRGGTRPPGSTLADTDAQSRDAYAGMTLLDKNNTILRQRALYSGAPSPVVGALMQSRLQRSTMRDESAPSSDIANATGAEVRRPYHLWLTSGPRSPQTNGTSTLSTSHSPAETPKNGGRSSSLLHLIGRSRPSGPTRRRANVPSALSPAADDTSIDRSNSVPASYPSDTHDRPSRGSPVPAGPVDEMTFQLPGYDMSDSSREGDADVDGEMIGDGINGLSNPLLRPGESTSVHGECDADGGSPRSRPGNGAHRNSRKGIQGESNGSSSVVSADASGSGTHSRNSTPSPSPGYGKTRRSLKNTLTAAERYTASFFKAKGKGKESGNDNSPSGSPHI
ncbi:SCF ubiquitin ligase complex subunit [Serendipita sp. 400]|nr:SCF ubiquitin ligase complex subunit [Serendipita sp. 400]